MKELSTHRTERKWHRHATTTQLKLSQLAPAKTTEMKFKAHTERKTEKERTVWTLDSERHTLREPNRVKPASQLRDIRELGGYELDLFVHVPILSTKQGNQTSQRLSPNSALDVSGQVAGT